MKIFKILFMALYIQLINSIAAEDQFDFKYEIDITETGNYSWEATINRKSKITVSAFFFVKEPTLSENFQKRKEYIKRQLEYADSFKDEKLKSDYKKQYIEDYDFYTASWNHWPIVLAINVYSENDSATKMLVIARHESPPKDCVFMMKSDDKLNSRPFVELARLLADEINKFSDEEWRDLPIEGEVIINEQFKHTSKEMQEFLKDTAFPKQH